MNPPPLDLDSLLERALSSDPETEGSAPARTTGPRTTGPRPQGPVAQAGADASVSGGLAAGQRVGSFELLAPIAPISRGPGGRPGQVWKARQSGLERLVLLKFLSADRVTHRGLRQLEREARAGGRLAHPAIVRVIEHGHEGRLAWIAMEYVPGERSLRDLIREVRDLDQPPPEHDRLAVALVAEIASALQSAHDAEVVHGDLKPRHILLSATKRPRVTGFGLARPVDEAQSESYGSGAAFWYSSPERIRAATSLEPAADIFSLGSVLYELLALRRPFAGDTGAQVSWKVLHEDPPLLRAIRSRVPREVEAICSKALEKSVGRRYRTMAAFAGDLNAFLEGQPVAARLPGPFGRARRWLRRHPLAFALSALALFAVGALLVLVGYLS